MYVKIANSGPHLEVHASQSEFASCLVTPRDTPVFLDEIGPFLTDSHS